MPPKRPGSRKRGGKRNRRKRARTKNSSDAAPLNSLLKGTDNQPHSKLNRPRPKGPASTKKKRGKTIFLESDDPLEKNIVQNSAMPDGYVFVPKGDVYITRHCRTKTKELKQMVYTVWDKAGKRSFGIRVPSSIHSEVLKLASETAESRAKIVKANDKKIIARGRELLRSEFPGMPNASLKIVLKHAFLKGSGRVGRTSKTSDEIKASLAVEAHIRHNHTPYDELLKSGMNRKTARQKVWPTVKKIRESWEGQGKSDDENEKCEDKEDREEREGSLPSVISISSSSSRAVSVESDSVVSVDSEDSDGSYVSKESEESLVWV